MTVGDSTKLVTSSNKSAFALSGTCAAQGSACLLQCLCIAYKYRLLREVLVTTRQTVRFPGLLKQVQCASAHIMQGCTCHRICRAAKTAT